MKILIDAIAIHSSVGGLTTYVTGLLNGWREAGFDDELITVMTDDAPAEVMAVAGRLGVVEMSGTPGTFSHVAQQQIGLPRLIARHRPDVLLSTTPVIPALRLTVPAVAVVHDLRYLSYPEEFGRLQAAYRRLAYTRGYLRSTRLIAISETTAANLRRRYPETTNKTVVVHHGCDHVDAWPQTKKRRQALAFGHWPNKRPDLALRLWARLATQVPGFDWQLHVVGASSRLAEELASTARALGVDHLTRIHSFLPQAQFQTLFAASRLLLFPTSEEGFGLPILEAMRLGIPVVTADIPVAREVGGDCALYADAYSEEELAAACMSVLAGGARIESMVEAGRERTRQFIWRRTAEQTRTVLEESLVGRRSLEGSRS